MTQADNHSIVVAALYAFRDLADPSERQQPLFDLAYSHGVMGTLLLAQEGVNGTVAGPRHAIDAVLDHIRAWPGFSDLEWKESSATEMPFLRLKVRVKPEIVTMGVPELNPAQNAGTYVSPEDWNALIAQDDVVVIDTRNDYEVEIGSFTGAINPNTESFRDFPAWSEQLLQAEKPPKVAMFCTGGIRCEKASAYLKSQGIPEVYHLKGGILKYLEDVAEEDSQWQGECFVFDRRVAVGHGLRQGSHRLCPICRRPFPHEDGAPHSGGVSAKPCVDCAEQATTRQRARAAARQKQIELAKARGERHLGPAQIAKPCKSST